MSSAASGGLALRACSKVSGCLHFSKSINSPFSVYIYILICMYDKFLVMTVIYCNVPCINIHIKHFSLLDLDRFLYEASVILEKHADTEGLFRKSGSVARQKELKVSRNQ